MCVWEGAIGTTGLCVFVCVSVCVCVFWSQVIQTSKTLLENSDGVYERILQTQKAGKQRTLCHICIRLISISYSNACVCFFFFLMTHFAMVNRCCDVEMFLCCAGLCDVKLSSVRLS